MDRNKIRQAIAANPNFTATRKVSLYSNFGRLEESNPVGFKANVDAWQQVLEQATQQGAFSSPLGFKSGPDMLEAFSDPQYGQPVALNTVIDHMVASQALVPAVSFAKARYPTLHSTWAPGQLASQAALWAVGKIVDTRWHSGDVGKLKPNSYIIVSQLRRVSSSLLVQLRNAAKSHGSTYSANIFSFSQLRELSGLSNQDVELCCLYLSRESGELVCDRKQQLVKLEGKFKDGDASIPAIKDLVAQYTVRLELLDRKVADFDQQTRSLVSRGERNRAKQTLRAKHAAEKLHSQIMDQQNQLELVLNKIDQATDQAKVIEALESGGRVLAERNKELSVERVTELMDSVQDAVADTDAIADQLANLSVDDDVLEEFEALEAEAKANAQAEAETKAQATSRAKLNALKKPVSGQPESAEIHAEQAKIENSEADLELLKTLKAPQVIPKTPDMIPNT